MSQNVRRMHCPADAVLAVLADGWLYPAWVVGASRMRQVDRHWPEPGAELHHSVGAWPLLLDDRTVSVERTPTSLTVLAKGWPLGEARVRIEVRTSGAGCLVRLQEEPTAGPARWLPRGLREPMLRLRNRESLRRLAFLSEGRAAAVNPPARIPAAG